MRANSQFAVAIHTLALLALGDGLISSSDIAVSAGTNPVFIRRIIGDLARAGLVHTHKGVHGGVGLARAAESISLLDVYAATHQGNLLSMHESKPLPECLCGGNIEAVLSPIFDDAEQILRDRLSQSTIAEVVEAILIRAAKQTP